jgi:hypothetical protein
MNYRPFSYYASGEARDAAALARLRVVLVNDLYDFSPPNDGEVDAIDRALGHERGNAVVIADGCDVHADPDACDCYVPDAFGATAVKERA